jgi:hypothetical protein
MNYKSINPVSNPYPVSSCYYVTVLKLSIVVVVVGMILGATLLKANIQDQELCKYQQVIQIEHTRILKS